MFSSPISKHEMEFYVETIYWGDILFMEICIISNILVYCQKKK